jgi:hypothetical protein
MISVDEISIFNLYRIAIKYYVCNILIYQAEKKIVKCRIVLINLILERKAITEKENVEWVPFRGSYSISQRKNTKEIC